VTTPTSGNGVAVGVVSRNDDPQGLGRVRVELRQTGEELGWARVATQMAGEAAGAWSPPAVGQVAFVGGDIAPIVIGVLR